MLPSSISIFENALQIILSELDVNLKDHFLNVAPHFLVYHKQVAQLQKKLMVEVNMRNALNRGLNRPVGSLPRIYASLPVEV